MEQPKSAVIESYRTAKNATSASYTHYFKIDFALSDSRFTQTNRCGLGRVPFAQVLLIGRDDGSPRRVESRAILLCEILATWLALAKQ